MKEENHINDFSIFFYSFKFYIQIFASYSLI